ncbi:kinase-like domain-containing protein [Favolaschia claudopus]|uniref:Kinase-like domain-containing protein n=1 Tax=Favolaschia claudopus TaxID=2862362 RepID=A0AAW0DK13_9AGAR
MQHDQIWNLQTIKSRVQAGVQFPNAHTRCTVVDIGNDILVKYGSAISPHEGMVTLYVAKHTTGIPIPKIHAIVYDESSQWTYIVQEKLPGVPLMDVLSTLDMNTRRILAAELRIILQQLQKYDSLGPVGLYGTPGEYGQTCIGEFLLHFPAERITTTEEFVNYLPKAIGALAPGVAIPPTDAFDVNRSPIFSHGDLVAENILVQNGHISGIIDWGLAGWYPYFWNDWIGRWRNGMLEFRDGRWAEMVDLAIEPFPKEYEAFQKIFTIATLHISC